MLDVTPPVTRLSTADAAFCCAKRVISPEPIEKLCQLMIAPGVLVTVSALPVVAKVAAPFTTEGYRGLAGDHGE